MTPSCVQSSPPARLRDVSVAGKLDRSMRIFAVRIPSAVARQMSRALAEILQWTVSSKWPEVAWSFSRLTGDGFPLEFTLSSLDATVRYTAEVAGPEVAEVERLPCALELIDRLETWELERLMGQAGLAERKTSLLNLLAESYHRPVQSTIPDENLGFSFSYSLAGG